MLIEAHNCAPWSKGRTGEVEPNAPECVAAVTSEVSVPSLGCFTAFGRLIVGLIDSVTAFVCSVI